MKCADEVVQSGHGAGTSTMADTKGTAGDGDTVELNRFHTTFTFSHWMKSVLFELCGIAVRFLQL